MAAGWERRRLALAAASLAVAAGGVATAIAQPRLGGPDACTPADVVATTGGLTVQRSPDIDTVDVLLRTRHECTLRGPLRFQSRASNATTWTAVVEDAAPGRERGWAALGNTGPQTAAGIDMDPATTYVVDVAWVRTPATCAAADLRLAGPHLALPMRTLPTWCGQPLTVSNTYAASVSLSVAWRKVSTSGTDLVVAYAPQCRGAHARIVETARTVTVAMLTELPAARGGCLAAGFDPITEHLTLNQPLGNRRLVHAPVGRWPALNR